MHRLSRIYMRKILYLYFQGYTHEVISRMTGIRRSTISEFLGILPESITETRELVAELKKQQLTVHECKKGNELHVKLKNIGVEFEQLESYVETAEKMDKDSNYTPKKVVQGAMKLNELERKSGRTYPETLTDFANKNNGIEKMETKRRTLKKEIKTLKANKKRELAENNVTENEISYVVSLRKKCEKYNVDLSNVENLNEFIKNMEETGGNPKKFTEYTREHGSLVERTAQLQQEVQKRKLRIQNLKKGEERALTAANNAKFRSFELDEQNKEEKAKLLAARQNLAKIQLQTGQELQRLGCLLGMEPGAQEIAEALTVKKTELDELNNEISQKQTSIQSLCQRADKLDEKSNNIEHEIKTKLRINDYASQTLSAIQQLQSEKASLIKETTEKAERLALADAITAFLIERPYEFDQLCLYVEQIKTMRNSKAYKNSIHISVAEEKIREIALKAFKGHLATTAEYVMLQHEKEESDKKNKASDGKIRELEQQLANTKNKLESEQEERRFTEAVKANFEGKNVTIGDIRNLVLSAFQEEIEKRADEKFNAISAITCGAIDFVAKKLTDRVKLHEGR